MRVTLLDLGVGNLHSLAKALEAARAGVTVTIETDAARAVSAGVVVLPGVGAFAPAAERLSPAREALARALVDGRPCLGICLGMQLLFESSDEGPGDGLGIFAGRVTKLATARTPHMGWSPLAASASAPAWPWPDAVYYAHSYACRAIEATDVVATTELDVVRRGNTVGCQFHPEKSSRGGLALLGAILEEIGA